MNQKKKNNNNNISSKDSFKYFPNDDFFDPVIIDVNHANASISDAKFEQTDQSIFVGQYSVCVYIL